MKTSKNKLSLSRVATNAFLALVVGFVASMFAPVSALAVGLTIFVPITGAQIIAPAIQGGYFAPMGSRLSFMAIQTEVWVADIMDNLFFENEFINLAVDHSGFVNNITVHVPQAGSNPSVVVNRSDDETAVTRRTDDDLTYNLSNYTTDPVLIKDIESLQVSYSKRASVTGQHIAVLNEKIAVETLYKWAVSGSTAAVIRTTGDEDGDVALPSSTATGTRLLLTKTDIAKAAAKMDLQKAPKSGRFLVIPTCMFYGLFNDSELLKIRAIVGEDMLKMGVVGELFGFNIIVRGEVVRYTSAGTNTLKSSTAADAATDCAGAVGFSRFMVSQAKGSVAVYINEKVAKSYGDIFSAEVNHGASRMRNDNAGVVCIAQGYVAP